MSEGKRQRKPIKVSSERPLNGSVAVLSIPLSTGKELGGVEFRDETDVFSPIGKSENSILSMKMHGWMLWAYHCPQ